MPPEFYNVLRYDYGNLVFVLVVLKMFEGPFRLDYTGFKIKPEGKQPNDMGYLTGIKDLIRDGSWRGGEK